MCNEWTFQQVTCDFCNEWFFKIGFGDIRTGSVPSEDKHVIDKFFGLIYI